MFDRKPDPGRNPSPRIRSLLTPGLIRWLVVSMILAAFMLANTLYLLLNRLADRLDWTFFAAGKTSLPKIYQLMVLSHTGAGLLTAVLLAGFAVWHLPRIWKRRRRQTITTGIALVVVGLVLAVTGMFILTAAVAGQRPWAWWTHVICAIAAPTAYCLHRLTSYVRLSGRDLGRFGALLICLLLVLVAGHGTTNRGLRLTPEAREALAAGGNTGPGGRDRDVAALTSTAYTPESFVPPASPFFPSAATTTTGSYLPSRIITRGDLGRAERIEQDLDQYGFVVNELIGAETCDRCHADVVEQWSRSAHRFASFNNPFYEATINLLREHSTEPNEFVAAHQRSFPDTADREGMIKSKWCSGCHDPAIMLAGNMDKPIDRRTPQAQAGLTCLACHAIDKIHDNTGNGNYNISDEQEDPYLFASAVGGLRAWLHDSAIRVRPEVHKRQMLKPVFKTGEYCATCHKVSLDVPVNNYRWLRGQNEYDNWHDSGVARNASRTFYLPPTARQCQDCHMPLEPAILGDLAAKNGMVKSHRFLAVNTALPFIRGDSETIERVERFLQTGKLRVDVFALRTEQSDEPIMALDRSKPTLVAGESVEFTVVVRNLGVGHTFPGGTNDSNEGWLEVTLLDHNSRPLAVSGAIGPDGHLDPAAHKYHALMVDARGNPIHKRNAQDIHTAVYTRTIAPGTADGAHYALEVPHLMAGKTLTIRARLLWRKFDRAYTEFAYSTNLGGFKRFERCPDLPVTEIATDQVTLSVAAEASASPAGIAPSPDQWMRFNDYGIAHILQGNTRLAELAFDRVRQLQPDRLDGHRNLTRVAIRDGSIHRAYDHLRACEKLAPGDPQTAWFWGVVLQEDGRYADAAAAYRRVLQEFPNDRATWRNLGRTLYLDGEYAKALEALDRVLDIDPEDRVAHQHRMFCFRAMNDDKQAAIAREAFKRYAIDESAQQATLHYLLRDKDAEREKELIHIHELEITGLQEQVRSEK